MLIKRPGPGGSLEDPFDDLGDLFGHLHVLELALDVVSDGFAFFHGEGLDDDRVGLALHWIHFGQLRKDYALVQYNLGTVSEDH